MVEQPLPIYKCYKRFESLSCIRSLGGSKMVSSHQIPKFSRVKRPLAAPSHPVHHRLKTSGGIIRYCTKYGDYKYAIVQGRYSEKWSFPKGHIQDEETSYECCIREIGEETGLEWLPIPRTSLQIGYGYYYVFEVDEMYEMYPRDKTEIMKAKWVTIDEMQKMSLNADLSQYVRLLTT